jgi:flagellar biosynthesis/type III secretory pathway protein FliH
MTSVIRSTRLNDEPLVLVRTRKADAFAVESVAPVAEPGDYQPQVLADALSEKVEAQAETPVAPPVDERVTEEPPPASYEEYEARFGEELDTQRAQAREEGYAEGLKQGQKEGKEEYNERLRQADDFFIQARDAVEGHLDGLADTAVEIVFEAVSRILGEQYVDKAGAEAAVREVIRQSKERARLVVRVSPLDFEALSNRRAELVEGLNAGHVELVADDLVQLGGCVLETPSGSLDGRLEIQVQRLRETLLNARQKWHEHSD